VAFSIIKLVSAHKCRRKLLCLLAASVWVCGASRRLSLNPNTGLTQTAQARPPSVVLVTLDTVRADHIACYGYRRIETPSIDQLAREGIRFEQAYAQVPLTLPSHAVLLTGTYPMFSGVRDVTSTGLPATVPTLAEILRQNGYRTAGFVSSFVLNSKWGLARGFELYDDQTDRETGLNKKPCLLERRGDRTMNRALSWLDSRPDGPFFLWVHLYDPHHPYRPPEPYLSRYAGQLYDGEIAFDDAQLGRLFAHLRRLKIYDDTLIVLAGDHGESLGDHGEAEHGFFIYNATLRVPLILKTPGSTLASRVVTDPVSLVDLAPAIAKLSRIAPDSTRSFQSHSLSWMYSHQGGHSPATVYAESYYPRNSFGWHELRAVITPQFKYIGAPRPELYDLKKDPDEKNNLAASQSSLAAALRERLEMLEGRYANVSVSQSAAPLDSETLEKLKSLGYLGYQAPAASGDSRLSRADPKDKILVFNQVLHARELRSLNRFAEADEILTALKRSEPALYIIAFDRGENLLSWGKPRAAVEEFRKAVALNPSFDQAWLGLGRAAYVLADNKQAADALRLALRLNPRNYLARRQLARVYWREDRPKEAESELAEVAREHPGFAEGRAEHGIALAKLGRYREALAELNAALTLGYYDAVVYNYAGIAYAETGDREQALKAYEKAVQLDPHFAAAYLNLALQYRKRGELAKARQYYRKTCDLSVELCRQYSSQF
jgi:arylsulfatase A-like enzyme/Flp pilus assembly protein TadD